MRAQEAGLTMSQASTRMHRVPTVRVSVAPDDRHV